MKLRHILLASAFWGCLLDAGYGVARGDAVQSIAFAAPAWRAGETGTVRGSGFTGPVKLAVADDAGHVVWRGEVTAGADRTFTTVVPVSQAGYYVLNVDEERPLNFAVVPSPAKPQSTSPEATPGLRFGVCTHFAMRDMPETAYNVLQKMGVDAVRDELYWGNIETAKDSYQFPPRYDYVTKLAAHGLKLFWVAGYGIQRYGGRKPTVPEGTTAFGRYCAAVLQRYGANIVAVEVYNEPNDFDPVKEYFPLLRDTYRQIRGAGFAHPVIAVGGAGVGGGMNTDYAQKLFKAGGDQFCDGFSQHPYVSPHTPDAGYPTSNSPALNANLDLALGASARFLKAAGKTRGGWITEIGWPAPTSVSERKQAAFTARTLLAASRYPHLEGIFIYDFQDDGPDPKNKEHRFGLVRQDLTPKPAYQAYAVAAGFLKDKTFVRRIFDENSLLTANVYQDRQGDIWVACWTTEVTVRDVQKASKKEAPLPPAYQEIDHAIRFNVNAANAATGFDWQGRPLSVTTTLTASSLPIYFNTKLQTDTVVLQQLPGGG